jgi:thymidylate synthase
MDKDKNIEHQYLKLLQDILDNGVEKKDRTGTGTISVFGRQIRHKMSDGFPLLTTKKMAWKTMVTELLWFLRGDTNIKYLVDNGCNIWNGDVYKNYASIECNPPHDHSLSMREFIEKIKTNDGFAKKWGELGPIYGAQWRDWNGKTEVTYPGVREENGHLKPFHIKTYGIDQIQNLINDLKTNPDSRRLMVNAWNVGELDNMVLPPCHYGFQVYTKELGLDERIDIYNGSRVPMNRSSDYFHEHMDDYGIPRRSISLMWNQRSVDTALGLPFNIASYGLLLEIIGNMVNMIPDELIANLGDTHIYKNQIDGVKEQLTRTPMKLPNLIISDDVNFNGTIDDFLDSCTIDSFKLDGYGSHPSIKMPLSN